MTQWSVTCFLKEPQWIFKLFFSFQLQLSGSLISVLFHGTSVLLSPQETGLKRCTCHCNRLIIACGAGRLVRMALPLLPCSPHPLLGERPGACAHWGWMTHNYHSDRARSHLPSSPDVSLTHLAHMTNDRITPNLRPLPETRSPTDFILYSELGYILPSCTKQTNPESLLFFYRLKSFNFASLRVCTWQHTPTGRRRTECLS